VSSAPAFCDSAFELPGRYSLRPLSESDLQELHALMERNRDELARWLSWAQRPDPESTREHIARALARERDGSGIGCAIVIDRGAIVGDVGLHIDRENDGGAIGYWLDAEHRGRGVMSAAVVALVNHGFTSLALRRIEIRTDVLNRPSRAIAERLGFQLDGVLRQSYRVGEQHYSDDAVYSMLASDPARGELAVRGASTA
jgi:ribosomal-protein-serine acetyltransferase